MVFGIGEAISLGSAALGALGSSKNKSGTQQTGFAALPESMKDLWLKTWEPAVEKQFQQVYQAVPTKRYAEPISSPFFSQGMADFQGYSDAAGGLLTPTGGKATVHNAQAIADAAKPQAKTALDAILAAKTKEDAWKAATMFSKADAERLSAADLASIQSAYTKQLAGLR